MNEPSNTLTVRHYWADTDELHTEHRTIGQPGTAAEARQDRIARLRRQGRPFTTTGGTVAYLDHHDHGVESFSVRVELDWTDDNQPDLFTHTTNSADSTEGN